MSRNACRFTRREGYLHILRMVSVLRLDQRIGSVDYFGDEQAQFFVKLPQFQVMCVR